MTEELLKRIEAEAARQKTDRVKLINKLLAEILKASGLLLSALALVHAFRSPTNWSGKALMETSKASLAFVKSKF